MQILRHNIFEYANFITKFLKYANFGIKIFVEYANFRAVKPIKSNQKPNTKFNILANPKTRKTNTLYIEFHSTPNSLHCLTYT